MSKRSTKNKKRLSLFNPFGASGKRKLQKRTSKLYRLAQKRVKLFRKKLNKQFQKRNSDLQHSLIIGSVLLVAGMLVLGLTLYNLWRSQKTAAQSISQVIKNNSTNSDVPLIEGTPAGIQIPSVGIDLKVVPGYYYPATKSWTLSLDNAHWGVMTAPANSRGGLTLIYAHYRKGIFLNLPKIQSGASATVVTDNGHTFTYIFRSSATVGPGDTRIFAYQGKPILVLQTCTGIWYQNRQLFVFDLVKAD